MTDEKKLDKASEHQKNGDKPALVAPITNKDGNKEWHENRAHAKKYKITGHDAVTGKKQASFTIHMGDGVETKDPRPPRVDKRALPQEVSGNFDSKDGQEYRKQVQEGIQSIPPSVQHYLNEGRWAFRIDQTISENDPEIGEQAASGHKEGGGSFAANFGATDFDHHRIIVSEKANPLNRTETTYEAERENPHADQTLRHETGHALDAALRFYSHTPEFTKAYNDCCEHLPPDVRAKLGYYLQSGDLGKQELFAELFAAEHGGGPNKADLDPLLQKYFAPCMALIKKQEAAIKDRDTLTH